MSDDLRNAGFYWVTIGESWPQVAYWSSVGEWSLCARDHGITLRDDYFSNIGARIDWWEPINTAPRDRKILVAYRAKNDDFISVDAAIWQTGFMHPTSLNRFLTYDTATHWMPIPERRLWIVAMMGNKPDKHAF